MSAHRSDIFAHSRFNDPAGCEVCATNETPVDALEPLPDVPNTYREIALAHLQLLFLIDQFLTSAKNPRLAATAAKRKLAELFQSEGFVQENQPLTRHSCRLRVFECLKFLSFCLLHQLHFSAFLLLVVNSFCSTEQIYAVLSPPRHIKVHCETNRLAGAARRIFQKCLEIAYSRKSIGPRIHLGVIVVALIEVLIH